MARLKRMVCFSGFLLAVMVSACASRPDEQIGLTRKAQDQAKAERASEYAPSDWQAGEQAWEQAQSLLARESYGEAAALLLRAKVRYEKARNIAKAKRDELLKEIQGLQKAIDLRYKGLKADMDANSGKVSAAGKKSLEDSCVDIDKGIEKARAEVEQGIYTEAKTTVQTTIRQVYEAEMELQGYLGKKKS